MLYLHWLALELIERRLSKRLADTTMMSNELPTLSFLATPFLMTTMTRPPTLNPGHSLPHSKAFIHPLPNNLHLTSPMLALHPPAKTCVKPL
ncbi:hypothetical protein DM01DRAFT_98102 [Hesseltinella vesiculosa]|uniref:Uncharacterized protein n=1 Tax=Hesseltinella vesiculosa TaxID=101127 RepID=A0A1X2GCP5_9FUNG|nr:hypothetical protein DM01DRAFT_98102 [Hesseltinella vesiculosa]